MFVEKIKGQSLKRRIEGYVKNVPRRLSHDNPTQNPKMVEMMSELFKGDDMICLYCPSR